MSCSISPWEALEKAYSPENLLTPTGLAAISVVTCGALVSLALPAQFSILAGLFHLACALGSDRVYRAVAFLGAAASGSRDVYVDASGTSAFALVRVPFLVCGTVGVLRFALYLAGCSCRSKVRPATVDPVADNGPARLAED